jgi:hypothetical protein
LGGGATCSPFALIQGAGGRGGGAGSSGGGAGSHAGRLGASGRRTGDLNPAVGVPAAGLTNRHAALIKGRQRGQHRRSKRGVIIERRDALGKYQGFKDKGLTSNPLHQEFQLLPGQISSRPTLDPADIVRAGEPAAQAWSLLQRRDPALQEITDHMHGGQATGRQGLDPVQHGQELWR